MKEFLLRRLYRVTLFLIMLFIMVPAALVHRLFSLLKLGKRERVSYFEPVMDVKNMKWVQEKRIRTYSALTRSIIVLLSVNFWLGRLLPKKLSNEHRRKLRGTPNQLTALVINQIVGNVRCIKNFSEHLNAKYIFALQPTLLDTGAITENDKVLLKQRNETKYGGFFYNLYFKVYYGRLRALFLKDETLNKNYLDLTQLFVPQKEQRFIDVAHMGNKGQKEMAQAIADEILKKST